jgi:hypothetical protein
MKHVAPLVVGVLMFAACLDPAEREDPAAEGGSHEKPCAWPRCEPADLLL